MTGRGEWPPTLRPGLTRDERATMTAGEIPTPDQVRAAREAADQTQAEAAALIWVSEIAWRQWESGARRMTPVAWWAYNKRAERRMKK
jgi:DNA-binding transcriptional regulator YiaG